MPSAQPLPTIDDHIAVAENALLGERDRYGDTRRGAIYDHASGPTAILFARQADRDLDSFRAIYFDDADGTALTTYVQGRFPDVPRVLDTYGTGYAVLQRPNATAGADTFFSGARISIPGSPPSVYVVSADTTVAASALSVTVPIRADVRGTGTAISVQGGTFTLMDVATDPTWTPVSVFCSNGTDFEPANEYRARARAATLDARNGYLPELVTTCMDAGAAYVMAFPSHYGLSANVFTDDDLPASQQVTVTVPGSGPALIVFSGAHGKIPGDYITLSGQTAEPQLNATFPVIVISPTVLGITVTPALPIYNAFVCTMSNSGGGDYGSNALYVADKNFASTPALVNACQVALEGARVLGADLWVGGIVASPLSIVATLNLIDDPSRLQTVAVKRAAAQALLAYFGPSDGGYVYKIAAMQGAVIASHPAIQSVTFSSPSSDTSLTPRAWPATLTRYTLQPRDIAFTLVGPV
jgi:hypothetical protein